MTAIALPTVAPRARLRTAVRIVLVVFPALYLLHSFFPHTRELFGDEDHGRWGQFWGVVAVLHWSSVAAALVTLRRFRLRPLDIGLSVTARRLVLILGSVAAFGLVLVLARTTLGRIDWWGDRVPVFGAAAPATTGERLLWIPIAMTAGFCEEVVYRGFGIGAQRSAGVRLRTALAWSTVAFVFLHGISAFFLFPVYVVVGLAFAWLYLRTGSVLPGIVAHSVLDLMVILVS